MEFAAIRRAGTSIAGGPDLSSRVEGAEEFSCRFAAEAASGPADSLQKQVASRPRPHFGRGGRNCYFPVLTEKPCRPGEAAGLGVVPDRAEIGTRPGTGRKRVTSPSRRRGNPTAW